MARYPTSNQDVYTYEFSRDDHRSSGVRVDPPLQYDQSQSYVGFTELLQDNGRPVYRSQPDNDPMSLDLNSMPGASPLPRQYPSNPYGFRVPETQEQPFVMPQAITQQSQVQFKTSTGVRPIPNYPGYRVSNGPMSEPGTLQSQIDSGYATVLQDTRSVYSGEIGAQHETASMIMAEFNSLALQNQFSTQGASQSQTREMESNTQYCLTQPNMQEASNFFPQLCRYSGCNVELSNKSALKSVPFILMRLIVF
jgi:hypothetical protein